MDGRVIEFGTTEGLRFVVEWAESLPDESDDDSTSSSRVTAERATSATLAAWIGKRVVWGSVRKNKPPEGLRWTLVEILEHLADSWIALMWEENPPFDLNTKYLSSARDAARERWEAMPAERVAREEEALWAFEESHDLAKGFHGAWPQSLWLLREGSEVRICAGDHEIRRPFPEVRQCLIGLGNSIAARLQIAGDARAKDTIGRWEERDAVPTKDFIRVASGLSSTQLQILGPSDDLAVQKCFELPKDGFAATELLAAARMVASIVPGEVVKDILDAVRKLPRTVSDAADTLARKARTELTESARAYDEGYAAALWLRSELNIGDDERVEPEKLLVAWGIPVQDIVLSEHASSIDAVSVWGPRHGPCVLINPNGRFAETGSGRRTTCAHELCHVLLDRDRALPLAEVAGGRSPVRVEMRARAFAVEFLLPRSVAADTLHKKESIRSTVDHLTHWFGVSSEVVAWQLRNSEVMLSENQTAYLRRLVRSPARF